MLTLELNQIGWSAEFVDALNNKSEHLILFSEMFTSSNSTMSETTESFNNQNRQGIGTVDGFSISRVPNELFKYRISFRITIGYTYPKFLYLMYGKNSQPGFSGLAGVFLWDIQNDKLDQYSSREFSLPIIGSKVCPVGLKVKKNFNAVKSGEEILVGGEHHHSVIGDATIRPVLSTKFFKPSNDGLLNSLRVKPQLVEWGGKGVSSGKVINSFGNEANYNSGFFDSTNFVSAFGSTLAGNVTAKSLADLLVNVLEVYIMADNKVRILGKEIVRVSGSSSPITYPSDSQRPNINFLAVNTPLKDDNRQLTHIKYEEFRNWIVGRSSVTSSSSTPLSLTSLIQLITFTMSPVANNPELRLSPSDNRQVAIVFNSLTFTNKSEFDNRKLKVKNSSGTILREISPGGIAIFIANDASTPAMEYVMDFNQSTQGLIDALTSGNYPFTKVNLTTGNLEYITGGGIQVSSDFKLATDKVLRVDDIRHSGASDSIIKVNSLLKFNQHVTFDIEKNLTIDSTVLSKTGLVSPRAELGS